MISSNAQIRIVSFDTYRESSSLKDSTRIARKKRSIPPRHFSICLETDIERVSMSELLASNTTKKSLTELLMPQVIKHMKEQNADYVVAGNCKTYWSLNGQIDEEENDHEEADSLMIRCLKLANDVMTTNIVKVYSSDTDVFLLLLSHSDKINCQSLFMCLVKGNVDIKLLCEKLGNDTSKALLTLHALTGCDTTGKFEGKSKQFWFRRFLAIDQHNTNLVKELADFQESNESTGEIESFICRGYLYRSNKDAQRKVYETAALNVTRYSLFTKKQLEGEKLPPTKNAFKYHLSRAHFQLSIWSSACNFRVNYLDPLYYG